ADVGVSGARVAGVGPFADARAGETIDATGLAVAPGFINMLSHSYLSMLHDGCSLGELKQGVTLQVFGEGNSMGPLSEGGKRWVERLDGDFEYTVGWESLAGYLEYCERKGVSQNVASYIGAT